MSSSDATQKLQAASAEAGATIAEEGRKAAEAGSEALKDLTSTARDAMRDHASARAEDGRDMLADEAKRFADSLREQSDGTSDKRLQQRLLGTLADGVSDISDNLRGKSPNELWSDVRRIAEQNPGVFAVGAGLAGFALARFLIASETQTSPDQESHAARPYETGGSSRTRSGAAS